MVTLWEEKSAVANESTFQELSRLHKRIEASDRMLHKPIGLYIKRIAAILLLPLLGAFGTYYYLTKVNPVVEEAQLKECFCRKWRTETSKTARWDESLVELRFFTGL